MRRINETIEKILNHLIKLEQEAAQIYLAMGYWADLSGFKGTACFFKKQADEERKHMDKILQYMVDRNVMPCVCACVAPPMSYETLRSALEASLKHEKLVTDSYNEAHAIAIKENDRVTASFLKWYLDEQVEEEATITNFIDRIDAFGATHDVLYMLDNEIGEHAKN